MSAAFDRFRYSFFDDPLSARDGLDTSSLADPQAMMIRVMSKDAARHERAKHDILAAIAGRTAGKR